MSDTDTTEVHILPIAGINTVGQREYMRSRTYVELLARIDADRKRGPVHWQTWYGQEACTAALRAAYADDDRPVKTFGLDQFEAFFEQHPRDCCLIIATCEVLL